MNTYTTEQVRDALTAAVEARGRDYRYPGTKSGVCFYSFEDGTPGCIVGAVIAGLDADAFAELVRREAPWTGAEDGAPRRVSAGDVWQVASQSSDVPAGDPVISLPYEVIMGLKKAQTVQDDGGTWGQALDEFNRTVEGLTGQFLHVPVRRYAVGSAVPEAAAAATGTDWLDMATTFNVIGHEVDEDDDDAFQAAADADLLKP
jgi:hypothetical protein